MKAEGLFMAAAAEEGRERADRHYQAAVICLSVSGSCCDPAPPLWSLSTICCLSLCLPAFHSLRLGSQCPKIIFKLCIQCWCIQQKQRLIRTI